MWIISKKQDTAIEQTIFEEFLLRVCKYVSDDSGFSYMTQPHIRQESERILTKTIMRIFEREKYCAEYVKLAIKHPEILTTSHNRDINLILENRDTPPEEKIKSINYYINN